MRAFVAIIAALFAHDGSNARSSTVEVADQAIKLMRRCSAVVLPDRLPEDLRKKVGENAALDYDAGRDRFPGYAFFEPLLVESSDPELAKRIRRFWKTTPEDLLTAIPRLTDAYFRESGVVQDLILRLVITIVDDSFHVHSREERIEKDLLRLLRESTIEEHRLKIGQEFGRLEFRVSTDGYQELLSIARAEAIKDGAIRSEVVRALATPSKLRFPPEEVGDYLLQVVARDACVQCRVWSVSPWEIQRLGCDRVLPVYHAALRENQCGHEMLVSRIVQATSGQEQCADRVAILVDALSSCYLRVQVDAVLALERLRVVKDIPRLSMEIQANYSTGHLEPADADVLKQIVSRWQEWWAGAGSVHLRSETGLADSMRSP